MKNLFTLLLLAAICHFSHAQTSNIPNLVNFQGIARDVNGNLIVNQAIQVQISILEGSSLPGATAIYSELHQPVTDAFGAFQIVLNENTFSQNPIVFTFANIPWNTGNKWAKIEYQTTLGGTLIELATIKLTSSFYAFASRTAEVADSLAGVSLNSPQDGQALVYDGTLGAWKPMSNAPKMVVLTDQKAYNVAGGGDFPINQWVTRDLNSIAPVNNGFVTLNTNQFTLQPGQYFISASAPAYAVNSHVIKLRNITNGTDQIIGRGAYGSPAYNGNGDSDLSGIFSITAQTIFEIQHRCETAGAGTGLGIGQLNDLGITSGTQTFTIVEIMKLD